MPMFSIVIPTYNRRETLPATLESVFAQECGDYEVIVVDDGSTDGTPEFLRERYGDKLTVLQQANRGPGAARNLGIARAAGEYVAFLDSDDLWFPWTLTVYSQAIARFNRPAVLGGAIFSFRDEVEARGLARADTELLPFDDYFSTSHLNLYFGTSLVIRRDELLRVGGMVEERINAEDHDLLFRLGASKGFVYVKAPATRGWRRHPDSAVGNWGATMRGIQYMVRQEKEGRYPGGPSRRDGRRHLIAIHLRSSTLGGLAAGLRSEAWALYWAAFPWNLSQGRLRYLAGFPIKAVAATLTGSRRPTGSPS